MKYAYAAVVDGTQFGIGLAEQDRPGFWPQPRYGQFPTYELAAQTALQLNQQLGHTPEEGYLIVASSMRGSCRRRVQ